VGLLLAQRYANASPKRMGKRSNVFFFTSILNGKSYLEEDYYTGFR
jgi:hypothetical protein